MRKLAALRKYAFAVFAMDNNGNYAKPEKVTAVTSPRPLKVGTSALESGIRGLYLGYKVG